MKKILFLLFLIPVIAAAQIPDFKPNTYVNDFTSTLTDQQIRVINDSIYSIEKRTSVQIAIVIIDSVPENISIEDYAMGIGRKWRVGNAANGLVYVAALQQRKQRLEVAAHLEGDIPDIVALDITNNIKPYFRNKDYFGGLLNMLKDINQRVDPVAKEQLKLAEAELAKKRDQSADTIFHVFIWIVGLIILYVIIYMIFILPRIRRRHKEEEEIEKKRQVESDRKYREFLKRNPQPTYVPSKKVSDLYVPPVYVAPRKSDDDDSYRSKSRDDDNSSNYGNWGSGSSNDDNSSGFKGGGASNDW